MVRFTRTAAWATCSALAMLCAAPAASAAGTEIDDVIAFLKTLTDGYTR
jgi:hypothetical protein